MLVLESIEGVADCFKLQFDLINFVLAGLVLASWIEVAL